jgi:Chaperone of endosialidase
MKTKTMTTLHLKKSMCRSLLRLAFFLIPLALAWFAFLPTMRAQLPSPTPDGGYPGNNTAEGLDALHSLTSGTDNTAIGSTALFSNITGSANTATGSNALARNDSYNNTATGVNALSSNTTGSANTATGKDALLNNNGNDNTAAGAAALQGNTTGKNNTANGLAALVGNTTGNNNTANGFEALFSNQGGTANTASGFQALFRNIGNGNIAEGFQALANNTGSFNVAVGYTAGANLTTGHDNIDIGALGAAGESNTMRIGTVKQTTTYIKGIYGKAVASGVGVIVNSTGQLGTVLSSARFKTAIKPMDKASEAILSLQPVTFRYKHELDPDGVPQFGLVAEQVEKVNPDLVVRDEDGKVTTVRYEAVNAMLLNEFLKEHRKVQSLEAKLAQQETQIEALTTGLQKVSAVVELNKSTATQVADNH